MAQCPERCVGPQGSLEVGFTDPDPHGMSPSQHRDPPPLFPKTAFGDTWYVFMYLSPCLKTGVFLISVSVS